MKEVKENWNLPRPKKLELNSETPEVIAEKYGIKGQSTLDEQLRREGFEKVAEASPNQEGRILVSLPTAVIPSNDMRKNMIQFCGNPDYVDVRIVDMASVSANYFPHSVYGVYIKNH